MSDTEPEDPPEGEDVGMASLLKQSLGATPRSPDLTAAVHRRIRRRSKGKFFRDAFSTTPSRSNIMLIALTMMVLVAAVYFLLGPTGIGAP